MKEVGEKRTFSFSKKEYIIREIVDYPNYKFPVKYDSGICPHCKKRIEKIIEHTFYRLEILTPYDKDIYTCKKEDVVILGDTLDRRKLLISQEDYKKVLSQSKLFLNLIL